MAKNCSGASAQRERWALADIDSVSHEIAETIADLNGNGWVHALVNADASRINGQHCRHECRRAVILISDESLQRRGRASGSSRQ
jgi:hypothetical protein